MCKENHNRMMVRKTLHKPLPAVLSFFSTPPCIPGSIANTHSIHWGIEIRLKCRMNALFYEIFFLSIEAGTFAWQKKRTQILLSLTLPPRVTEKIGIPSEYKKEKKKGGKYCYYIIFYGLKWKITQILVCWRIFSFRTLGQEEKKIWRQMVVC